MNQQPKLSQSVFAAKSMLRAKKSVACLPFKRAFYELIDSHAIDSNELCQRIDRQRLAFETFRANRAEDHFAWLIQIGVVRREVDGQGLTNRIRLTPMGRAVIKEMPTEVPRAGIRERIAENLRRYFKFFI